MDGKWLSNGWVKQKKYLLKSKANKKSKNKMTQYTEKIRKGKQSDKSIR